LLINNSKNETIVKHKKELNNDLIIVSKKVKNMANELNVLKNSINPLVKITSGLVKKNLPLYKKKLKMLKEEYNTKIKAQKKKVKEAEDNARALLTSTINKLKRKELVKSFSK